MLNVRRLALFLGALLPAVLAAPAVAAPEPEAVPGKWIVTLKASAASHVLSHLAWVSNLHAESLARRSTAGVEKTYNIATWNAYAGEFDEETIARIRESPDVEHVSPDYMMHISDGWQDQSKRTLVSQPNAPWGLATTSHRNPGYTNYIYESAAISGAFAYVIDSSCNTAHVEFGGRAIVGYNAVGGLNNDTLGHGTHVAGTIAGSTFGVMKQANIIAVKVFTTASSPTSVILDGFTWAVNDIIAKGRQGRAVINMSLGGPANAVWNGVIKGAFNQGISCVVAAGNGDPNTGLPLPVSGQSPANVLEAITVGAMDFHWVIAGFSNFGAGVDIIAPGVGIISAWYTSNTATAVLDGTSMATPHVTGLCLYLLVLEAIATPALLAKRLIALGTPNRILGSLSGSPNLILYNGNGA